MMSFLRLFERPVNFLNNTFDKLLLTAIVSLFFSLFLIVYQPFGVNNYDQSHRVTLDFVGTMGLYGLMNALVLSVNEFLIRPIFPNHKNWGNLILWTIWRLFLLSAATFLFYNYLGNFHDWHFSSFLGFIKNVSSILIFPITGLFFYFHYRQIRQKIFSIDASSKPSMDRVQQLIWLVAENNKDRIGISCNDLLYLKAFDNYVRIFYNENEQLKKRLLRSTLKQMETQLEPWPILRCHRSYMINLHHINRVEKKRQRLFIHLKKLDQAIPVSPRYEQSLIEHMSI